MSLLEIDSLSKRYRDVPAIADISFSVGPGEVRGLVGENGSGKSTTIGILAGAVAASSGEIRVGGVGLTNCDIAARKAAGVGVVFQHPNICLNMTVAENLFAGRLPRTRGVVRRSEMEVRAQEILDAHDIPLLARSSASVLSTSERHLVEVARMLTHKADVIAFDETTAALTDDQVDIVFKIIRRCRDAGAATVVVSHRLDEIVHICDSVTVLRDGRLIETKPRAETSVDDLVALMVGREFRRDRRRSEAIGENVRLRIRDLQIRPDGPRTTLDVRAGETVGIAGLVGSGRSTLLEAVFGIRRRSGEVLIDGSAVPEGKPRAAIEAGVGLVPEDRHEQGLAMTQDIMLNASMVTTGRRRLTRLIDKRTDQSLWNLLCERMRLRAASARLPVSALSGGNQQKVVLGRWLHDVPKVLLLDEPTRGIDVGAKQEIYDHIDGLRRSGVASLVVSSDLEELHIICDRILVLRAGAVVGEFHADAPSQDIGMAMAVDAPPHEDPSALERENS